MFALCIPRWFRILVDAEEFVVAQTSDESSLLPVTGKIDAGPTFGIITFLMPEDMITREADDFPFNAVHARKHAGTHGLITAGIDALAALLADRGDLPRSTKDRPPNVAPSETDRIPPGPHLHQMFADAIEPDICRRKIGQESFAKELLFGRLHMHVRIRAEIFGDGLPMMIETIVDLLFPDGKHLLIVGGQNVIGCRQKIIQSGTELTSAAVDGSFFKRLAHEIRKTRIR